MQGFKLRLYKGRIFLLQQLRPSFKTYESLNCDCSFLSGRVSQSAVTYAYMYVFVSQNGPIALWPLVLGLLERSIPFEFVKCVRSFAVSCDVYLYIERKVTVLTRIKFFHLVKK